MCLFRGTSGEWRSLDSESTAKSWPINRLNIGDWTPQKDGCSFWFLFKATNFGGPTKERHTQLEGS